MSVSDGICQKSDIAVENSLTKRKVDVGAALNSKPKGCRNRDHVDRLHLKMTGLSLFRPLLSIERAGEQGECGWEDRARDGRARDVAGMTLGRIGNTKAAVASTTGQRAMDGMAVGKRTHKSSHNSKHRGTADRRERASGQMGGTESGGA